MTAMQHAFAKAAKASQEIVSGNIVAMQVYRVVSDSPRLSTEAIAAKAGTTAKTALTLLGRMKNFGYLSVTYEHVMINGAKRRRNLWYVKRPMTIDMWREDLREYQQSKKKLRDVQKRTSSAPDLVLVETTKAPVQGSLCELLVENPTPTPMFEKVSKSVDVESMTVGEAKKLYNELHALFGRD